MGGDSWEFGRRCEELVMHWLKCHGYFVGPASLIERGGAALLEGYIRSHVLPDILAAKDGGSSWIDVKGKGRMTFNRRRGRWETGIALRHWEDYLAVQGATGIAGGL